MILCTQLAARALGRLTTKRSAPYVKYYASSDPYLGLLACRSTPLSCGYSPAELLMSRQLRSIVPIANNKLTPIVVSYNNLHERDAATKLRQKNDHDRRNYARHYLPLQVNERIWVPDINQKGRVMHALPYRDYQLQMENGAIIKHNARSICRAKPLHVLSNERAPITKAINIKPSDTSNNLAPTQQTTPEHTSLVQADNVKHLAGWTRDNDLVKSASVNYFNIIGYSN